MKKTKIRALYIVAALLAALFVLSCLVGFVACGGGDEHEHTWDAGEITTAATCEGTGVRTYTCTECGETKTETIPATGHTWDEGKVTTPATTEAEGEMTYTCEVCGATKTEKIDKIESSGDDDEGNEPGTGDEGGDTPGGDENPGTGTDPTPDPGDEPETEATQVSTADALVAALATGGEIELAADITVSSTLEVTVDTELDLVGHTLTGSGCDTITVSSGVSFTIDDSTGTGTVDAKTHQKAALVNEGGTVTLNGGTFERSQEKGASESDNGGNSYYTVVNHGTMTINEGVSVLNAGDYSSNVENGYYSGGDASKSAALTINGGTICGGLYAVKNDSCGILTVNGGTIGGARSADDTMPYRALLNWNVAYIYGGKLLGGNSGDAYTYTEDQNTYTGYGDGSVIYNTASNNSFECGKLTIGDGKGNGPEIIYEVSSNDQTYARYADAVYMVDGEVTVAGGLIGFDIDEGEERYCYCTGIFELDGKLTVSGGTISGDEAIEVYGDPYTGTAEISGGTFEGDIVAYALNGQTGTSPLTLGDGVKDEFNVTMYSDWGNTVTDNTSQDALIFVYTQTVAA